jgi:hypothetical protein
MSTDKHEWVDPGSATVAMVTLVNSLEERSVFIRVHPWAGLLPE